ncbi:MAG: hypothetical protein HY681_14920 [Chloroflexi bacterium]|nr:hypothetical protein [Chloroflexota bacterium]
MVNVQRQKEQAFAECLEAVQSGRASLEQALEGYPNEREQLEPLLRLALRLPSTPAPQPSPEFRLRARMALQAEIARQPSRSRWAEVLSGLFRPSPRLSLFMSARATVAALLVAVLVGGTGVTYASQGSLPGATLYSVKLASERGVMLTKVSPESKARYHISLAERRADEVVTLSRQGKSDQEAALAVAHHLDSAIGLAQRLPEERAQSILQDSARELGERQATVAQTLEASESQSSLSEVEMYLRRGHVIASALSEDSSHLSTVEPIARMREAEIVGPISDLSPLRIGSVEVAVAPDAKVEGTLVLSGVAKVKGVILGDGRLLASKVEVKEQQATPTIDLQGAISSLDPLMIAGHMVTVSWDTEVKGALIAGLKARVKGTLLADGSIAASKIEAERVRAESKLQGVVSGVGPLTIGGTAVVLAPEADIEGSVVAGAVANLKGRFLDNGQFLALEMKLSAPQPASQIRTPPIPPLPPQPPLARSEGKEEEKKDVEERKITGRITQVGPGTVTVTAEDGSTFDLQLAPDVRIRHEDDDNKTPVELKTGQVVDVKFDPATGIAARIEVDAPDKDDVKTPTPTPTPEGRGGSGGGEQAGGGQGSSEGPSKPGEGSGSTSGSGEGQSGSSSSQTGGSSGSGSGSESQEENDEDEEEEVKIEGVIIAIDGPLITVEDDGERHTIRVTDATEVKWDEDSDSEAGFQIGDEVEVKFDSVSGEAHKIEVEEREEVEAGAAQSSETIPVASSTAPAGAEPSSTTIVSVQETQVAATSRETTVAQPGATSGTSNPLHIVTVKGVLTLREGDVIQFEDALGKVYVGYITPKTLYKTFTSQPFAGFQTGQKIEVKFDTFTGAVVEVKQ